MFVRCLVSPFAARTLRAPRQPRFAKSSIALLAVDGYA
jgi:hypothetical protein